VVGAHARAPPPHRHCQCLRSFRRNFHYYPHHRLINPPKAAMFSNCYGHRASLPAGTRQEVFYFQLWRNRTPWAAAHSVTTVGSQTTRPAAVLMMYSAPSQGPGWPIHRWPSHAQLGRWVVPGQRTKPPTGTGSSLACKEQQRQATRLRFTGAPARTHRA
jgi:hypothetical protein